MFKKFYKTIAPKIIRIKIHFLLKKMNTKYELISFPKSGRTWLRYILANLMVFKTGGELSSFFNSGMYKIDSYYIKIHHGGSGGATKDSKFNQNWTKQKIKNNNKVIFLVRDPRDVVVSYYYQCKFREKEEYSGDLKSFVRDPEIGIDHIINYMNKWTSYLFSKHKKFLLIKYEELHKDPIKQISKINDFLNLKQDYENIKTAVENSKFEKMRKLEENNPWNSERLKPIRDKDQNTYKTRKGKAGGYKDELEKEDIIYIEKRLNENLNKNLECYKYNSS